MSTGRATEIPGSSGDNLPVELWRDILEETCRIPGKDEFGTDPRGYWDMPYDKPPPSSRITSEELQNALNTRLNVVLVCKSWHGVGMPILHSHFRPRLTRDEALLEEEYREIFANVQLRDRVRRISIAVGVSYRKAKLAGEIVPQIASLLSLLSHPVILSAPRTVFWQLPAYKRSGVIIADLHLGALNTRPESWPNEDWENLRYISILLDGVTPYEYGSKPMSLPALTTLEIRVARRGSINSLPQNLCEGWQAPILTTMSLDDDDWTRWKLFLERHSSSLELLNVQCYPKDIEKFPSISLENLRELWMEPAPRSYYPNTLIQAPRLERLVSHRWRGYRYHMDHQHQEVALANQFSFLDGMLESWSVAPMVQRYCISGMSFIVGQIMEEEKAKDRMRTLRKRGSEMVVVSESEGDHYRGLVVEEWRLRFYFVVEFGFGRKLTSDKCLYPRPQPSLSEDNQRLVYRTGKTPWIKPTGPEAYRELKELRGVFGHKINDVWNTLGHEVRDLLDEQAVLWSSIDVVRFRMVGEAAVLGPVVLWIGVLPDTLIGEDAFNSANGLLELLKRYGITDVDIEYRESVYRRSVGPPLLESVSNLDSTVDFVGPLTAALGLPIAGSTTRNLQGTMGFYLAEGGESEEILAVTARHVLFPPNEANIDYARTKNSTRRKDVLLMGTKALRDLLTSIRIKIGDHGTMLEIYEAQIKMLEKRAAGDGEDVRKDLTKTKRLRDEAIEAIDDLEELQERTKKDWSNPSQRIIGHVVRSPAITVGTDPYCFTKDYAVVKLEKEKFRKFFKGNVLDLGTEIPAGEFTRKMYPRTDTQPGFKYPYNRLLPLRDIISEDLMRHPSMVDHDGEPSLYVIKNGLTTGVIIGQATGIFSHVREYFPNQTSQTSMEWSILPYNNDSGVFSAAGDSGSVIVDGLGHYGGLLTGGAGKTASSDVTYATPIWWLLEVIKENGFPDAHLHLTMV